MFRARFIFVEGIPGIGKTTTVEFLVEHVQRAGLEAHPLWEGPTVDKPEHPLRIAPMFPHPVAIWENLTVDRFVALSLRMWREFAETARRSSAITVCDGLLFHGNMTDLMLMDAPPAVLHQYVHDIVGALAELSPALVYLREEDVEAAIRAIGDRRGARWREYQVGWKVASPYAVRRGLAGFEGLVEIYREYQAACDAIFAELDIPKVGVRADGEWERMYREMLGFLKLPTDRP